MRFFCCLIEVEKLNSFEINDKTFIFITSWNNCRMFFSTLLEILPSHIKKFILLEKTEVLFSLVSLQMRLIGKGSMEFFLLSLKVPISNNSCVKHHVPRDITREADRRSNFLSFFLLFSEDYTRNHRRHHYGVLNFFGIIIRIVSSEFYFMRVRY